MASRVNHQDVVRKLLEAKAVDFGAVGKLVAEMGPTLALSDEPWEGFCGTMRYFIHIYRLHQPSVPVIDAGGVEAQ